MAVERPNINTPFIASKGNPGGAGYGSVMNLMVADSEKGNHGNHTEHQ